MPITRRGGLILGVATALACEAISVDDPDVTTGAYTQAKTPCGSPLRKRGRRHCASCAVTVTKRTLLAQLCGDGCSQWAQGLGKKGNDKEDDNISDLHGCSDSCIGGFGKRRDKCHDGQFQLGRKSVEVLLEKSCGNFTASTLPEEPPEERTATEHGLDKAKPRGLHRTLLSQRLLWQRASTLSALSLDDDYSAGQNIDSAGSILSVVNALQNMSVRLPANQKESFEFDAVTLSGLAASMFGTLFVVVACSRSKWCRRKDDDDDDGSELPCGLTEHEVFDLLNRDITPEDYDLLLRLDEASEDDDDNACCVDAALESVCDADVIGGECVVCLSAFQLGNNVVALRRCHHHFHENCIQTWLTEGSPKTKGACPLCRTSIVESV